MTRPVVSTIIPIYNSAASIAATIASLQAQTLGEWEAICVDDGSADASVDVVSRMAGADARVRVVRMERNAGVSAARNRGLDEARGDYLHFLDSDDAAFPRALEMLVRAERTHGRGGAVGDFTCVNPLGETLTMCRCVPEVVQLDDLLMHGGLMCGQHLVRRSLCADMRFDTSLETYEDTELWMRMAERGICWTSVGAPVFQYMIRPGSLSKRAVTAVSNVQRTIVEVLARAKARPSAFGGVDVSASRTQRLLRTAAVSWATRTALVGGVTGVEIAARQYERAMGPKRISAELAAQQAYCQVVFGVGVRPRSMAAGPAPAWSVAIEEWWATCVRRGWAMPSMPERAWKMFTALTVDHEDIATAILERCSAAGVRGIEVIGYGNNGRALANLAARRGLAVQVRDDRFERAMPTPEQLMPGVLPTTMEAALTPGWLSVVTPLQDDSVWRRFPGSVRWRCVATKLLREARLRPDLRPVVRTATHREKKAA